MRWGNFSDAEREYVITRPDTPWPWINYLGSDDFFSLVSNAAGGYSFYKDARLRRLTRYRYNDVPLDDNGRLVLHQGRGNDLEPGLAPDTDTTGFLRVPARAGIYQDHVAEERHRGGPAALRAHRGRLRGPAPGAEERPRPPAAASSVFSLTEFCLWNALDDMTNFQRNLSTGEVEVEGSAIYHVTEYRERRNHYAFYSVNAPVAGFDTDRESFTGRYDGVRETRSGCARFSFRYESIRVVTRWLHFTWRSTSSRPGEERSCSSSGTSKIPTRRSGRSREVVNKSRACALAARFDTDAKVDRGARGSAGLLDRPLSRFTTVVGDERLDRMVNIWNQYQCMTTCNMARSASYFESGIGRGIGFRDTSQDLLGCVHQVPARVRERLFDVASTQHEDGGAWHQYQPLTKRGNADVGDGFNDDPLWLILGVSAYLKETGDWAFLEEQVPFDNNPSSEGVPVRASVRGPSPTW